MTQKRLEIAKLVGRIHIGQQPRAAVACDNVRLDHVYRQIFEQFHHLQAPLLQVSLHGAMAGAPVDGTQRMISAFGPRHDSIHRIIETDERRQKAGCNERHIARHQQQRVVSSLCQGSVEASKRAAVGNPIPDHANADWRLEGLTVSDEQDVVGELTQHLELPIEDSSSVNLQRAFVSAAKSPCSTARKNRSTGHNPVILLPA